MKFFWEVIMGFASQHPLLGGILSPTTRHAGSTRNVREPEILDQPMWSASHPITLEFDTVRNTNIEKLAETLFELGEAFKQSMVIDFYKGLSQITEATGNTLYAEGQPFSFDMLNDMWEKIEIEFDENDRPILSEFLIPVPPNIYEKIKDMKPTPEQEQRFAQIIEQKLAKHNAKKRTRRLSE